VANTSRGHRTRAHTADVILEAWGPDLAACCEEAVAALVETYADRQSTDPASTRSAGVHVAHLASAPDDELLLAVLDEVIFVLDTSGAVPVAAEVRRGEPDGLDVELCLADPAHVEPTGSVPKAISRSELVVERTPDGVRCQVLVDL
jgi:SHS2 domain-containing protein